MLTLLALAACTPDANDAPAPDPFPEPDAFEPPQGPGGPARAFTEAELFEPCGFVLGGPGDAEHHNLLVMHDGYLVHPWAPEDGAGGVSFFDFTDPCAPALVGQGFSEKMRESHTLAFGVAQDGREYLAVDYLSPDDPAVGGVGFFDVTDRTAPVWVSELATPGFYYPDSYLRVTFANFWQGDVVYVAAAFNGFHIVDASDPLHPALVSTYDFDPPHLVGSVTVVGNLAVIASAGTQRVVLMDVSDPFDPQPIVGGSFDTVGSDGEVAEYYFSSLGGRYALFARQDRGGGPLVYDLTDPTSPTLVGDAFTEGGDGAYVYRQTDRLFQGDSEFGVVWDFTDPNSPTEIGRIERPGDLDTMSPIGNVFVMSVDSGAPPGEASSVYPHQLEPDAVGPTAEWPNPPDGATGVALTSRVGVVFDEWVEWASVFEGSFRVATAEGRKVTGRFNVQEAVVNFTPDEPLEPDTTYVVTIPTGGVTDYNGNPTTSELQWRFSTGR